MVTVILVQSKLKMLGILQFQRNSTWTGIMSQLISLTISKGSSQTSSVKDKYSSALELDEFGNFIEKSSREEPPWQDEQFLMV